MNALNEKEISEIRKALKRRSRFVWKDDKINDFITQLNDIRTGKLSRPLDEPVSAMTKLTWRDFYFELDMLKYFDPLDKNVHAVERLINGPRKNS